MSARLPIDDVLPDIVSAVSRHPAVVVTAPPGAGKTTRVPSALLDAGLAGDGDVLLLQPRRAAARLVARRIASERGCRVGEEVGYAVRFDRKTSSSTRLTVLTEGLLTRRIQADPFLEGTGIVVLDEVHERSLHADLALALVAEVAREAREDLKLVLMSATLEVAPLLRFLGEGTPVVASKGRTFPVDVRFDERPDDRRLGDRVAAAVRSVLQERDDGHVLAFLPGVREIEDARGALSSLQGVDVLPLHGRLPAAEQDRALSPSRQRKVVLSTNIAETSVTIDGVVAVVDSGLERVPVFDVSTGVTRLDTQPVSRASADQRAGRAGRTAPGVAHRLWTRNVDALRPAFAAPEIETADLAPLVLEVLAWGADPRGFRWLTPPPEAAVARALDLLRRLGAVEGDAVTPLGRQLAKLPLHPRLARVVVEGHRRGVLRDAAGAAALATERDPWGRDRSALRRAGHDDLAGRLALLDQRGVGADPGALRRVIQVRDQIVRVAEGALGRGGAGGAPDAVLDALIAGFPDRVARRREGEGARYHLSGGSGAELADPHDPPELLVAVELQGRKGRVPLLRVAAPLDPARLPATTADEVVWDPDREGVAARRVTRFGALVLRDVPSGDAPDPVAAAALLAEVAGRDPVAALQPGPEVAALQARIAFLRRQQPDLDLPDLSLDTLLPELCEGRRSVRELRALDLVSELLSRLPWPARQALDDRAPARLRLPTGSTVAVSYDAPDQPPVVAARIQQLFGLPDTPRIAGEPVVLHLLAPNNRPAQVTRDLAGFWAGSYADVRKDLRGRYPKHAWPEDPLTARPEDRPHRNRR